jgi:hypothetical protein
MMLAPTYVLRAQEVLIYIQQEHSANYIGAASYACYHCKQFGNCNCHLISRNVEMRGVVYDTDQAVFFCQAD